MSQNIKYVGDPFVDTGVAVLEHRTNKPCAEFTSEDLTRQAEELEGIYSKKAWAGYLTVHFPNSCWCNPSMLASSKLEQRTRLLRSLEANPIERKLCVYCARPAQHIGDRSGIPLITGATNMTCGANGEPGLPLCSGCQFAIQFYPLAAIKVEGRPLFWWSPDHNWMFALTYEFAQEVDKLVLATPDQVPSLKWPPSRLFEAIERVLDANVEVPSADLVGCHVTNYGSGPDFQELRVSKGIVSFLQSGRAYPAYKDIASRGWESTSKKTRKPAGSKPIESRRNAFYEDVGAYLWDQNVSAVQLLRHHFHPLAGKTVGIFELAFIFARRVLAMTQQQVEAIKKIATVISESPKASDHLDRLFERRGLTNYVRTLVEISDRMKRASEAPLALETVLQAFDMTNEDDVFQRDAALVRELILLALIEKLPADRIPELKQEENDE